MDEITDFNVNGHLTFESNDLVSALENIKEDIDQLCYVFEMPSPLNKLIMSGVLKMIVYKQNSTDACVTFHLWGDLQIVHF